ncbi:MAG TPA: 4Fe-4S ferredoxin, partial [Myxococcales bacterium]|nr:4Fe-4S ferredoxin [Myxococcales bacterium]
RPKLFYMEGSAVAMHPTATEIPDTFMWADVIDDRKVAPAGGGRVSLPVRSNKMSASGEALRSAQPQGLPSAGPIKIGQGTMAEHMVQVSYNAQHKIPWHWPVPAYLVTKAIGAGALGLLAIGLLAGIIPVHVPTLVGVGFASLLFTVITTVLLVIDLERPERFLRIIFRPQWRSWLTRGAFLLIGFSTVSGLWWSAEFAAWMGWLDPLFVQQIRVPALGLIIPLALGAIVYTAFLFGQAEGRDLWQNSLLPVHLIVQATAMGAGTLLVVAHLLSDAPPALADFAAQSFVLSLVVDLLVIGLGKLGMPHASEVAAKAAHEISHGRYAKHFWLGGIALGHLVPLALVAVGSPLLAIGAAIAAAVGLYFYEYAFVMAPQEIPNS